MAKAAGNSYSPCLRPPRQLSTLLGEGRWKSTHQGNSLATYSTLMRSSEGGREKSTH